MKAFNMYFKPQALNASKNPVAKTDPTLKGGTTSKPLDPQQKKNLARLERLRYLELQKQNEIRKASKSSSKK